jgi:membrane fusion protein (multidrug efflux system)
MAEENQQAELQPGEFPPLRGIMLVFLTIAIGLSMQVEINTRGAASIPRTQPAVPLNTATRTDVFRRYGEDANAEITRIIAQNSTGEAGAQTQLAHAGTPRNTAPQM